ncbi:MAG: hypothetical protein HONBIEJF_01547 [Fimbriimonadaceae bacterium]|nr:hypothetical protein [Fimbriimonadaceae bacterium]
MTFLIGHPAVSWSPWLAEHGSNVVSLDVQMPPFGPPGCITAGTADTPTGWRFVGSLDPTRYPLAMLAGLRDLASPDCTILGFPYRPSPVGRQLLIECIRQCRPERILAPSELSGDLMIGATFEYVANLPAAPTHHAQAAKRRGRWIECLEACETHHLTMPGLIIEGVRLGSGIALRNLGGGIDYAEVCGKTVLLASREPLDDHAVAHTLDVAHADRAVVVTPEHYIGLICAFAREDGTDFGVGRLTDIDFAAQTITCRCTAVAPAPVKVLKLGSIRVDETGRELPQEKPWAV